MNVQQQLYIAQLLCSNKLSIAAADILIYLLDGGETRPTHKNLSKVVNTKNKDSITSIMHELKHYNLIDGFYSQPFGYKYTLKGY